MTSFFKNAIEAIPSVAASPLALAAYVVALVAYVIVALRVKRNAKLVEHLEKLPRSDRLRALRDEMGISVPDNISADQWLLARSQQYRFLVFAITAAVIAFLGVLLAFSLTSPRPKVVGLTDAVEELLKEPLILRCFINAPSSWIYVADSLNGGPVVFEPHVGAMLAAVDFKLWVEIFTGGKEDGSRRPHFTEVQNPTSDSVKSIQIYEDGFGQGFCALRVSGGIAVTKGRGESWSAELDWDPVVTPEPDDSGSYAPFVRFRCTADKTLPRSIFIKLCQILIERTTSSPDSASFSECRPDSFQGFARAAQ